MPNIRRDMPMRATTVRFSEDLWRLLEREAEREGVSAAQFIRDASVMRAAYAMGRRGEVAYEALAQLGANGHSSSEAAPEGGAPLGAEEARRLTAESERRRAELLEEAARRTALLATAAAVQDPARLAALRKTGLLDSAPDPRFDRHVRLAAEVLNAPIALVSLVDEERQFFKSAIGVEERETPLSHSFCQHAIAQREPLIVDDAREHPLLKHNPAVEEMSTVAYAGVPLIDADGFALGTLCVLDSHPRQWTKHQVELLGDLAASVVNEITLATVEE
jgi:GAF domain-containing protein